jgi:hypothetical protein
MRRAWEVDGFGKLSVVRREDGAVLGRIGLLVWDPKTWVPGTRAEIGDSVEIEIGWQLRRDAWGAGYATEAARAVREWPCPQSDRSGLSRSSSPAMSLRRGLQRSSASATSETSSLRVRCLRSSGRPLRRGARKDSSPLARDSLIPCCQISHLSRRGAVHAAVMRSPVLRWRFMMRTWRGERTNRRRSSGFRQIETEILLRIDTAPIHRPRAPWVRGQALRRPSASYQTLGTSRSRYYAVVIHADMHRARRGNPACLPEPSCPAREQHHRRWPPLTRSTPDERPGAPSKAR